eukprot:SAG31_NODE_9216_length_1311_cov_1.083882_2_plen_102_part_00
MRALLGYCSGDYGRSTESDCVAADHEWVPQPPELLPPYRALVYAMKVRTVCCTCRCDSTFSPNSNANLAPGQDRTAACTAHCGVGGPECGAQRVGQFEGFC